MPASSAAAFGCPASLPASCGCWLGLLGLGAAPAAYAGGLLLYYGRARRRRRRRSAGHDAASSTKEEEEEETGESKLGGDGNGSTSGGPTTHAAGDGDGPSPPQEAPSPPPRRWAGVVKDGAWPGLFWREALVYLHIGYQLYRLLPLLGVLAAPSGTGGRSGDLWWGHNLVRMYLFFWDGVLVGHWALLKTVCIGFHRF